VIWSASCVSVIPLGFGLMSGSPAGMTLSVAAGGGARRIGSAVAANLTGLLGACFARRSNYRTGAYDNIVGSGMGDRGLAAVLNTSGPVNGGPGHSVIARAGAGLYVPSPPRTPPPPPLPPAASVLILCGASLSCPAPVGLVIHPFVRIKRGLMRHSGSSQKLMQSG